MTAQPASRSASLPLAACHSCSWPAAEWWGVVGGGERRPVGRVRLGLPVLGEVLGRGLVELGWGVLRARVAEPVVVVVRRLPDGGCRLKVVAEVRQLPG